MRAARSIAALPFLLSAACGGSGGGADDSAGYDRIDVKPGQTTVTVALGQTVALDYKVYGIKGDEATEITAQCALNIDPAFGDFAAATLTVRPHGGATTVDATCAAQTGQAQLEVQLTGTVIGPGAPPNAADLFGAATLGTDPARAGVIEYPLDHAVSPRNIPSIEVQWTAAGNDLFHVALHSQYANVDVYTTAVEAMLTAVDWESLVGSAAGEDLAFVVEGLLQADPTTKYASAPVTVTVTNDTIDSTAIYYWASSQGQIMTQEFGSTDAPDVVKNGCTSCHSVSRTGTRIGYSRCVGNDCNQLFLGFLKFDFNSGTWAETMNADNLAVRGSYTTFAPVGNPFPDDSQALAMATLSGGTLALFDPDTGTQVPSNLDIAAPGGAALMPDWSHAGSRVVYVQSPNPGQWIDLSDGRIATMSYSYAGGVHTFGAPTLITPGPITLPSGTYNNFFFPSFSSDDTLIVFDAARAAWRNGTLARSPGQRLMLADANGAWTSDLPALNGGDGDLDTTWPHWAPTSSSEYYWVVFSSERDYGHRATAATSPPACTANGVLQCKQIWIGAIAKSRLGQPGVDPSAPPMWLPGQATDADNISPYWSVPTTID